MYIKCTLCTQTKHYHHSRFSRYLFFSPPVPVMMMIMIVLVCVHLFLHTIIKKCFGKIHTFYFDPSLHPKSRDTCYMYAYILLFAFSTTTISLHHYHRSRRHSIINYILLLCVCVSVLERERNVMHASFDVFIINTLFLTKLTILFLQDSFDITFLELIVWKNTGLWPCFSNATSFSLCFQLT